MNYAKEMIIGRVPNKVREQTKENMETHHLSLADAFEEAVRVHAKEGTRLWKAWYYNDFREYIPSAYNIQYLDLKKYPLKYEKKQAKKEGDNSCEKDSYLLCQ